MDKGVTSSSRWRDGAKVTEDSPLYQNLIAALKDAGDPYVPVAVQSYRSAYFKMAVNLTVNPDYLSEKVFANVEDTLRQQFSFDMRAFGQPVMLSEVMAVVQGTPGVAAVDVDKLYRAGETPTLNDQLLASLPVGGINGSVLSAELLMLDAAPVAFGVM